MDEIVDRVMSTFNLMRNLDDAQRAASRERLTSYMEKLNDAGRVDQHELSVYGLAYLRELQDGPASQFTGC